MTERVGMSEFPQRGGSMVWMPCYDAYWSSLTRDGTEVSLIRDIVGSDVGLR